MRAIRTWTRFEHKELRPTELQRRSADPVFAPRPVRSTCWTEERAEADDQGQYVDLVDNPEQYTGYSAAAGASRVWDEWHSYNNLLLPPGCATGDAQAP